jgi:hypothetical protein
LFVRIPKAINISIFEMIIINIEEILKGIPKTITSVLAAVSGSKSFPKPERRKVTAKIVIISCDDCFNVHEILKESN